MAIDVDKVLQAALNELTSERTRVDQQIAALRIVLDDGAAAIVPATRRQMSAAARRAIGQRMKAYWAKRRAAQETAGAPRTGTASRKGVSAKAARTTTVTKKRAHRRTHARKPTSRKAPK